MTIDRTGAIIEARAILRQQQAAVAMILGDLRAYVEQHSDQHDQAVPSSTDRPGSPTADPLAVLEEAQQLLTEATESLDAHTVPASET